MPRIILTLLLLTLATSAHAMHISEGILPFGWAALWFGVAAPFVAVGLRRLNLLAEEDLSFKPLVGLLAAVIFIISCMPIPVPTAGTCSHPCGTGIAAILVGPFVSVLITAVALLIQALFLAHGGLSTWGADIVSMGVVGSFTGYAVFKGVRWMGGHLPDHRRGTGLRHPGGGAVSAASGKDRPRLHPHSTSSGYSGRGHDCRDAAPPLPETAGSAGKDEGS